jgi:hypothetical protein
MLKELTFHENALVLNQREQGLFDFFLSDQFPFIDEDLA